MNISYKELNSIEIPLLSIEEQNDIAIEYERELAAYKKSIDDAESKWLSVLNNLKGRI